VELAGLLVSIIGFALTLIGLAIAIRQANSARDLAGQATTLLEHVKDLSEAQARTAKTVGEISVIDAYMTREFSQHSPDMEVVAKQYGALLARAVTLVGSEKALREMVGELR